MLPRTWSKPSSVHQFLQFVDRSSLRFDPRPKCLEQRSTRRRFLSGICSTPPQLCPHTERFSPGNRSDLNTGHPNSRFIWILDIIVSGFRTVLSLPCRQQGNQGRWTPNYCSKLPLSIFILSLKMLLFSIHFVCKIFDLLNHHSLLPHFDQNVEGLANY